MYYILSCRSRRHGRQSHPWLRYISYSSCILMMIFWWQWHVPQTSTSTLWSVAFYLTLAVPWALTLEELSPNTDFSHKIYQENGIAGFEWNQNLGKKKKKKKLYSIQFSPNSPNNHHHNDQRNDVSNHQPHDCLLKCLFRCRSKKTSKLCHWPLWGEFTGDQWIPCTKGQ